MLLADGVISSSPLTREPSMQVLTTAPALPSSQLEPSDKGAKRVLYQLTEEMDKRGGRLALVLAGKLMNPADDPG
jgi:hypothetical protein